ncbi:hypothetical protein [Variovorax boronicumulans]|uniref:hypothetical protein n=1 Tax=Variovorax boronicumulans TaxID=436515 RepID=UPI0012E4B865|nr:hypothetical protein [Variovorax boronicumulans]GER16695.1 hypothetical protein VCH24_17010 [Variovorax boronicumulans]
MSRAESVAQLADALVRRRDEAIGVAIARRIGPDWRLEELEGRLVLMEYRDGSVDVDLDGRLIAQVGVTTLESTTTPYGTELLTARQPFREIAP